MLNKLKDIKALIVEGRTTGAPLPMAKAVALLGDVPDDHRRKAVEAQNLVRRAMKSGARSDLDRAIVEVDRIAEALRSAEATPAEKVKPKRAKRKQRRKKAKTKR